MSSPLVTLATYAMPYEAHLARTRLEAEGIPAFIQDEHLNSLYTPALGRISLQVPEDRLAEARTLLERELDYDLEDMDIVPGSEDSDIGGEAPTCPHCGGRGFIEEHPNALENFVNVLLFGMPHYWLGRPHLCRACGWVFRRR